MSNPSYVTTPIYYVNDEPHIGHAYTTILADVLARYARLSGRVTFFLTGVDEHGQKVQDAARKRGIDPQTHVDEMNLRFRRAWEALHIAPDDFIRTTEPRHVHVVETVLQALWEEGEIYHGAYEGWYCVPDERFWTSKDLLDGNCPDCGRPVEQIVEQNYFFRMSSHQAWLINAIESRPVLIQPEIRRNEVLGFLRQPLGDLCISRPASRLSWGIPLPFDPDYVTYVWFDALLNYVTAAGYLSDDARFSHLWPQALHLIGKDILITHAVYWPTMLHAAGLPLPRSIFAHGWWLLDGGKISKSRGNAIRPLDLAAIYGADAFRYFLMAGMTPGRDATFGEENLAARYNADLVNDLGNLLHRVVSMIARYTEGRIPTPGALTEQETRLRAHCLTLTPAVIEHVGAFNLNEALAEIMALVGEINKYLERNQPWQRAREGEAERVSTILYVAAESLRLASLLLQPVMPERMAELWRRLGWQPPSDLQHGLSWGQLQPGVQVTTAEPLFPREVALAEAAV